MSCRTEWNRELLADVLPKTWLLGEYRKRREHLLVERQKLLLPETQTQAKHYMMCRDMQEDIEEDEQQIRTLNEQMRALERKNMQRRQAINRCMVSRYTDPPHAQGPAPTTYGLVRATTDPNGRAASQDQQQPKESVAGPCPAPECKGFVMAPSFACGTCSIKVCRKCMEPKESGDDASTTKEHTCDPGAIETYKLLRKDSRACPGCGALIFRISGCYQMWCTQCRTAFNFHTGQIEQGVVHNPHYFNWLRETGGNRAGANAGAYGGGGGGCLHLDQFHNYLAGALGRKALATQLLLEWYRCKEHMRYTILARYRRMANTENPDNGITRLRPGPSNVSLYTNLRIRYLLNEISEKEWQQLMQRAEKKFEVASIKYRLLDMVVSTIGDLLGTLSADLAALVARTEDGTAARRADACHETLAALNELKKYADGQAERISKAFGISFTLDYTYHLRDLLQQWHKVSPAGHAGPSGHAGHLVNI